VGKLGSYLLQRMIESSLRPSRSTEVDMGMDIWLDRNMNTATDTDVEDI
jgi:hypothetical protein